MFGGRNCCPFSHCLCGCNLAGHTASISSSLFEILDVVSAVCWRALWAGPLLSKESCPTPTPQKTVSCLHCPQKPCYETNHSYSNDSMKSLTTEGPTNLQTFQLFTPSSK
jgi:hypothetical protein